MNTFIPLLAGTGQAPSKEEYDEYLRRKKAQKHLKRAIRELNLAGKYGKFSITLTDEQLKQIDEARRKGDKVSISVSIT